MLISVVVPAHNAASSLEACLSALEASDLPRTRWELIVVNDGSTDATASIASSVADRVITIEGAPRGPAFARNRGAELANARLVAFVDADVSVHADALRLMTEDLAPGSAYAAVLGSYDNDPSDTSAISQYRNLLHHYVHNRNAGETATFWAGCGAVVKDAFDRVGGFDAVRYPRPQIEDIELGYRLGAGGSRMLIDPRIQGTHHKQWRFLPMLRTDLFDRGIPWVRLLLSSPARSSAPAPSLGLRELVGSAAVLGAVISAGFLLVRPSTLSTLAVFFFLAVAVWTNWELYKWFARQRGALFACKAVPLHFLYQLVSVISAPLGAIAYLLGQNPSAPQAKASAAVVDSHVVKSEESAPPRIFSPEYYSRMRDLESGAWWNAGMRDILSAVLTRAHIPPKGLVVDAGCGSGQTSAWFLSYHPEWRSLGVDLSLDGLNAAAASSLPVAAADVTSLPIGDAVADLVISLDVLQHLPLDGSDLEALLEFKRVLKPGGYLLLRTNSESWPRTVADPVNNFQKYRPAQLRSRLENAGFEVEVMSRANALLGLAEVPREMAATRKSGSGYHGLLATAGRDAPLVATLKRGVLRAEGAAISRSVALPFGRSIVALCRRPVTDKANSRTGRSR